jgi:hypothetical protein
MAEGMEVVSERGDNYTWMRVYGTGYVLLEIQNREAYVHIYSIDIWTCECVYGKYCHL